MGKSDTFDIDYRHRRFGIRGKRFRPAALGERVYRCELEKGKRWQKEDFPKTNWNTHKYLWLPQLGCSGYQMLT